ncbi:MAG TPA: hypothetical protein PKW33_21050 [Anaerolineaceae bacterium]|nr:hypothetical protein [Anaerolineaceae bacterium]HPN54098.1 hypothetical protein [Anaerolineaceae bacterium]
MIEIVPNNVDSAFLYFHTRSSSGDEIAPFLDAIQQGLPNTYIWAGDGPIEGKYDDPIMGNTVSYGTTQQRYWFVFPMQTSGVKDFAAAVEAMGSVLVTCGGYANLVADQAAARFHIPTSRVVLCGHQHGACVALAAAMMRRTNPYTLVTLFDPWPLETLYLQHEKNLPQTQVICIDNRWVRERELQRGNKLELYKVFRGYGINADGIILPEGQGKPDAHMFREAVRQMKRVLK